MGTISNRWTKKVTAFTTGWFIALILWRLIRRIGVNVHIDDLDITVTPTIFILFILGISLTAGLIFGSVQYFYEKYQVRSVSFSRFVSWGLIAHLCLMIVIYFLLFLGLKYTGTSRDINFMEFVRHPLLLVNFVYSILVNSTIIIIIQINKLLGKGNLRKLVMGKFHKPREEVRAFMFLDLRASTTIAERLGHFKYSSFIQDCFYHLSVVDPYDAHIYQYVGDEVVLTWKIQEEKHLDHCIDAFNAFTDMLESEADHYQSEYGVQPLFKAGLHLGPVTVVEVGNLKREIAYHGDTINVAARIQEQCKKYDRTLLVSEDAYVLMKKNLQDTFENVGEFVLRGRQKSTQLFGAKPR